ncbi:unnamed protein product [Bursaphelenchus xylophilus]|uniref:(pine wood nematode) hypothetical protein n=1 Tax=Bursaphelenchus xylophilus TaxID=6326 RepID=A0A1I7S4K4_BURXY|nr:unnamed protein product [Bursaphelenchus xylophilus]CAG9117198.1 unnamed protein product [Bursaphelenchus xylophilus]
MIAQFPIESTTSPISLLKTFRGLGGVRETCSVDDMNSERRRIASDTPKVQLILLQFVDALNTPDYCVRLGSQKKSKHLGTR